MDKNRRRENYIYGVNAMTETPIKNANVDVLCITYHGMMYVYSTEIGDETSSTAQCRRQTMARQ